MTEQNSQAQAIAQAIINGFDRHFSLFQDISSGAKQRFEQADWKAVQQAAKDRIYFYDLRVQESTKYIREKLNIKQPDQSLWRQVKVNFIRTLIEIEHKQPELAETFYNSVYFNLFKHDETSSVNTFSRPAISTEYMDTDEPVYNSFYPAKHGLRNTLKLILQSIDIDIPFEDIDRDIRNIVSLAREIGAKPRRAHLNFHIQILKPLFFRNKAAYLIGQVQNGFDSYPIIIPLLNRNGKIFVDTVLHKPNDLSAVFGFARSYFMVTHEIPSAIVEFLRKIVPTRSKAELYSALGLHKQGKTDFFRELSNHIQHSEDNFIIAPGIKGLVMAVFTLPSYPFVFKVIKDEFTPPKTINKKTVMQKYQLVKQHDRVGRMADTIEYSNVPFPKKRFSKELIEELKNTISSILEISDDTIIIKHLYIERRMIPLNIYFDGELTEQQCENAVREYGDAIRQMMAVNIFPGDMLFKNFGVTKSSKVVFYDYDEVCYLTECNFRDIPEPKYPEQEMSSEPWYSVAENDVFPEEFASFLLLDPRVRKYFMKYHKELLDPEYWRDQQRRILAGEIPSIYPYPQSVRFNQTKG